MQFWGVSWGLGHVRHRSHCVCVCVLGLGLFEV